MKTRHQRILANKPSTTKVESDVDVERLRAEFNCLLKVKDKLKRDYLLIQQAKASDIEASTYQQMFFAYRERQVRVVGAIIPLVRRAASLVGYLAVFSGLFLFVMEADSREQASHNEAWKILNDIKPEETSSAGRIGALQTLTEGCKAKKPEPGSIEEQLDKLAKLPIVNGFVPDCVPLKGLDAQQAHLADIELAGADLDSARLQDAGLWSAELQRVQLNSAKLLRAKMSQAILSDASLKDAEMQGVQLPNADLQRANLTRANLGCVSARNEASEKRCANLHKANLSGTTLENTLFKEADLSGANLSDVDLTEAELNRTILLNTNLSQAKISLAQLSSEQPPLLCGTRLPDSIEIDSNRDCKVIQQVLTNRYDRVELDERYPNGIALEGLARLAIAP